MVVALHLGPRGGYPIIQLPLAVIEGGGASSLFKRRHFWIGFGMAALLDITNGGLSKLYPFIPYIRVRHDEFNLGEYFTGYPWNAIGWLPVLFYPFLLHVVLLPGAEGDACHLRRLRREVARVGLRPASLP